MIESLLNKYYFGNTIQDYLISLSIFILGAAVIFILKKIVLKRLTRFAERTDSKTDNYVLLQINRIIIPLLYLGVLYFAIDFLRIPAKTRHNVDSIVMAIFTFFVIRFILLIINNSIRFFWRSRSSGDGDQASLKGVSTFIGILIWGLGVVFFLDNLGFKISAVIAGLGIGGIAVALAAQAVLGDFFSYFVIFFDRPFQIGDFISVDDKSGTVERIGIKTTRVQSLNGEQIVFPNSNLTNSRLHNFKRLQRRRIQFQLSVVYQTPADKIKEVPEILKSIIEAFELVTFDRAHFKNYGESGLTFEVVYYVNTPDYYKYMDIQQAINLQVYEIFEKKRINFSYPSRTLYFGNSSDESGIKKTD